MLKKRVLFAIPTLGGGGAEKVLVKLVNNMDNTKYDITLFAIFGGGVNKKYLNENIKYYSYFDKQFKGNIHLLKLFSPKLLSRLMIKEEYDIAISYLEGPATRILSGLNKERTKLLNWVHTEVHNPKVLTQSFRSIKEMINTYNKYDATIFVSDTAKIAFNNTFKEKFKSPKFVKYNTIDTNEILEKSREEVRDIKIDHKKINLVSVGRFTEQKGYVRLLEIMGLLIHEKMNIHLYLLGEGHLEKSYYEIIKKLDLEKHVTILGFKENPYNYIKNADIFVCSSYEEGYSTVVSESIVIGTPVVTTLCSGMVEMIGSNNEYGLITGNSDKELYIGLKNILITPGLLNHYKQKTIERAGIFNTFQTVKEIENLIDNI